MNKFTKKSLSLAIAALVTVTSSFSSNVGTQANAATTSNETTKTTTSEAPAMTPYPTDAPKGDAFKVTFKQPATWTNGYAYAYYTETIYTETIGKTTYIREPLGRWPGTKLDAASSVSFLAQAPVKDVVSDTRMIFTDVDAAKSDLTTLIYDKNGDTFYYNTTIKAQLPKDDGDKTTEDGYLVYKGETTIDGTKVEETVAPTTPSVNTTPGVTTPSTTTPVSTTGNIVAQFDAPADWNCVYAYAYYVDAASKMHQPLGMWPGTKLTKGADGKYTTPAFSSTTGKARLIFVNVDEQNSQMSEADIKTNNKGEPYYAKVAETARLPKDDKNETTEDGLLLTNGLNVVTNTGSHTVTPLNPTSTTPASTTPASTTPANTTPANTTPANTTPASTTPANTTPANTTPASTTPANTTPASTTPVTVAPATTAPATPAVAPSEIPMSTLPPVATPVVSASPLVTTTPVVTTTPAITATPVVEATVAPEITVPTPSAPSNDVVQTVKITGSVSFNKTGKTAGEAIKIKASAKDGQGSYKYTYYASKGGTRKTLAKDTTKSTIDWTPSSAGKYTIKVVIKDSKGNKTTVTKTYKVKARVITIKSFTANKKSGQKVNSKIKLTANATTKSGKVSYKFVVKTSDGDKFTLKGYSKKGKVTWEPGEKGTYTIYLYVKNGKGITIIKTKKFVIK